MCVNLARCKFQKFIFGAMISSVICSVCSFLACLVVVQCVQPTVLSFAARSSEQLRNALVVSSGGVESVYVGSSTSLYKLNDSLSEQAAYTPLTSFNTMLLLLAPSNWLLACQRDDCLLLNGTSLGNNRSVVYPDTTRRLIIATQEDNEVLLKSSTENEAEFFVGKARVPNAGNGRAASFAKISISLPATGSPEASTVASLLESDIYRERTSFASFTTNGFAYYVFSLEHVREVRVARICINDTGVHGTGSGTDPPFATYTEIELICRDNGMPVSGTYHSATFSDEQTDVRVLLAIHQEGQNNTNFICSYSLSTIDTQMDQTLANCLNGQGKWDLARRYSIQQECPMNLQPSQKERITACVRLGQFRQVLEVPTANSAVGSVVASHTGTQPFHSLLVTSVSGVSFIHAGSHGLVEQVGWCVSALSFLELVIHVPFPSPLSCSFTSTNPPSLQATFVLLILMLQMNREMSLSYMLLAMGTLYMH